MTQHHIPKGYKQTELGIIPEDWEIQQLGEIADIKSGGTPNTSVRAYWGGDYPWMNSGELHLKLIYYVQKTISKEGFLNSSTIYLPVNCVLIGLAGQGKTRGTVAINKIKLCINQSIGAIFPNNTFVQEYIYHNLCNRYNELRSLSTGDGGRGGLNVTIISNINIPIPPKPEQEAIAGVLSDVDGLIDRLRVLIAKKQDIKTATMQQLLTGKTRLPQFQNHPDGTPKSYQQSELGSIPEDWEVKQLGEIGIALIGLTYSPKDVSELGKIVLRSSNVKNNHLVFTDNVFVHMDFPERVIVKNNDLLICVRNGSSKLIGKCALINKDAAGMAFGAFMSVYRSIYNSFIFYMFQSDYLQKQIQENMGATINQITSSDLLNFIIFFPPLPEQEAIATILSDMDNEINGLKKQLTKTEELKQGIMQELLTGKTRLLPALSS